MQASDSHVPKQKRPSQLIAWDGVADIINGGISDDEAAAVGGGDDGVAIGTSSSSSGGKGGGGGGLEHFISATMHDNNDQEDLHIAAQNLWSKLAQKIMTKDLQQKDGSGGTTSSSFAASLAAIPKKKGISLSSSTSTKEEQMKAYQLLSQVPPFSYLPNSELQNLVVNDLSKVDYEDGDVILGQNDTDDDVYILAQGRVVMVQLQTTSSTTSSTSSSTSNTAVSSPWIGTAPKAKFVGYLDAPANFGEFGILFDAARTAQVMASSDSLGRSVIVYRMIGKRFQNLCSIHSAFRLKLALGLRKNGIFHPIESFIAMVRRSVAHDSIFDFKSILDSYRKMVPAIHANLHSPQLDIEGWTYAIRRLPDTITSTYVYLLALNIPMPFQHNQFDLSSIQVKTVARRRQAFALDDHGKLLVIMREDFSDVLDFLSLLCAHIHESGKLRHKLVRTSSLHHIHSCLWQQEQQPTSTEVSTIVTANTSTGPTRPGLRRFKLATVEEQRATLDKLPLTDTEKKGLQSLWPKNFLYRVWDIISVHENIQIRSDLSSTHVASTDRWAESIRRAVNELVCPPSPSQEQQDQEGLGIGGDVCLTTDVTSHIISSNTTSVRNLVSPYILKNKATIQEWGMETHPEIMSHPVLSESDKLCALCNAYMQGHPQARREQDIFDQKCFKTLRQTEMTGIQVELIDLNALEETYIEHDIAPDPFLSTCFPQYSKEGGWTSSSSGEGSDGETKKKKKKRVLINIDYAFGKQAEQLISALSLLLHQSLASVGVMGKAGGLQGRRGDIIVANYLVHQDGDEQTLIDNTGVDVDALHSLSGRTVHSGGVLTVLGTLLQDSRLLNFYKKLYGCVSLEMEGSFYARELRRFKKAGLLASDINLRFLYYVSDTPLSTEQTETLSKDMSIAEVIPPQYAVTRALLHPVLSDRS